MCHLRVIMQYVSAVYLKVLVVSSRAVRSAEQMRVKAFCAMCCCCRVETRLLAGPVHVQPSKPADERHDKADSTPGINGYVTNMRDATADMSSADWSVVNFRATVVAPIARISAGHQVVILADPLRHKCSTWADRTG